MKLVAGLGNPGEKYIGVRHNLGFEVVDELAKKIGNSEKGTPYSWKYEEKFKSEVINYTLKANRYTLVKPQTYMNNSGVAVKLLSDYYKIDPSDIIIIHDDLDILLGKIKVRSNGAAGGHHGVESIIESLGTDQFTRVRLGIGNDKRVHSEAEKFVLDPFLPGERSKVKSATKQAISILTDMLGLK